MPVALGNNYKTFTSPALAAGLSGADAELAFIDGPTGKTLHARLSNMVWSAPTVVGDGTSGVAITSAP